MKKLMLVMSALILTTLSVQANQKQVKAQFTVTQIALDAAHEKEALESQIAKDEASKQETLDALAVETKTQGGTGSKK